MYKSDIDPSGTFSAIFWNWDQRLRLHVYDTIIWTPSLYLIRCDVNSVKHMEQDKKQKLLYVALAYSILLLHHSFYHLILFPFTLLLGSFIATCAFDKTLSLFDFFSGELVSQVTGHSELMTSVRFSPDGSYILTAGGDGCIMKWALPYYITSAIQERILELELKEKSTIVPNPQEENKICEKAALPEPPLTIKNEKNILPIPQPCQYSQKLSQSLPHTQSRSKDFIDSHTDSRIGQFHTCVIEEADFENFHNNLHISSEDSDGAAENWLEDMVSKFVTFGIKFSLHFYN